MRDVEVALALFICSTTVFNEAMMVAPFPDNLKIPNITPYNGKEDPTAHVEVFHSWIDLKGSRSKLDAKFFP